MAVGVPRSLKEIGLVDRRGKPVELFYGGRRPLEEILLTPSSKLETVKAGSSDRLLIFAENLAALSTLALRTDLSEKIRLIYIDPPYATQTVFHSRQLVHAYEDIFEQAEYVDFIRERLVFLHRLLAHNGSIYVHIDDKMLFHLKLILDEIFGPQNYRNLIVRKKCNPKNYTRNSYGNTADYILFYTKSDDYVWNRQTEPWTNESAKEYQYVEAESGRKYMKVPIHAPGSRNGETGKPWRGMLPPPGKHWQYTPASLDEMDARGEIFWSKNGNPRRKVYLDESGGLSVQDIWNDFRDAHNQNIRITGYPTEKNLELLKRIVRASSNPGDLVLDCFVGSGTTLVAAEALDRRWIGIDDSPESLKVMLRRFQHGAQMMGDFVQSKANAVKSPTLFEIAPDQTQGSLPLTMADFSILATSDKCVVARKVLEESGIL